MHYRYKVGPRDYTGRRSVDGALWLAYCERWNARVPILVDPDSPNRSFLMHAFTLDIARPKDPIPRARVIHG